MRHSHSHSCPIKKPEKKKAASSSRLEINLKQQDLLHIPSHVNEPVDRLSQKMKCHRVCSDNTGDYAVAERAGAALSPSICLCTLAWDCSHLSPTDISDSQTNISFGSHHLTGPEQSCLSLTWDTPQYTSCTWTQIGWPGILVSNMKCRNLTFFFFCSTQTTLNVWQQQLTLRLNHLNIKRAFLCKYPGIFKGFLSFLQKWQVSEEGLRKCGEKDGWYQELARGRAQTWVPVSTSPFMGKGFWSDTSQGPNIHTIF